MTKPRENYITLPKGKPGKPRLPEDLKRIQICVSVKKILLDAIDQGASDNTRSRSDEVQAWLFETLETRMSTRTLTADSVKILQGLEKDLRKAVHKEDRSEFDHTLWAVQSVMRNQQIDRT